MAPWTTGQARNPDRSWWHRDTIAFLAVANGSMDNRSRHYDMWGYVKNKLYETDPETILELKQSILITILETPQITASTEFSSY